MFVCAGPGVAADPQAQSVSVLDFYPTFCQLMDLPEPDVDGDAIPALVSSRA
jgi:arylsulfatase A-like enzyme